MKRTNRPALLFQGKELIYDYTDKDGELFLLDRTLEGCLCLRFTCPIMDKGGSVTLDGREVPFVVRDFSGLHVLGVDLRHSLYGGGREGVLCITGFCSLEGIEMAPFSCRVCTPKEEEPLPAYASHEAAALKAAEEGIVLMKNEGGLLPFSKGTGLNFFGRGVRAFRCSAAGAGKIRPRYTVDLEAAALREQDAVVNRELLEFYACLEDRIPDEEMLKRAAELSPTAIFILTRPTGENTDNSTAPGEFYLRKEEEALLAILRSRFKKLLVILNTGYPVAMSFAEKYQVDGIVYCGFGGMLGGQALLNVLMGRVCPSGKLPDTWVGEYFELPSASDYYDAFSRGKRLDGNDPQWVDTVYREGIFNGYRYFTTFDKPMAYPFGFGLSYTTFAISSRQEGRKVCVTVVNKGRCPGRETVQLYVQRPETPHFGVRIELIDFKKTKELPPGESQEITFDVADRQLRVYSSSASAWVLEKGEYRLLTGNSCVSLAEAGSVCISERVEEKLPHRMTPPMELFEAGSGPRAGRCQRREPSRFPPRMVFPEDPVKKSFSAGMDDEALKAYVAGLSPAQLIRLLVCAGDGWGVEGTGEAGHLASLEGEDLPRLTAADGNSGVNMNKRNIGFPSGTTLAATFSRERLEEAGRVIGEEAAELGVDLILAPGFNLHRNPLCGRHAEYFSEDPALAGKLAAAFARGLESTGVGSCYKHLIANGTEAARKRNDSILSEQAVRELYFKAFAIALDEYQPVSVMTAYNQVNGLHACEDADLIQGLLRDECGFSGFVMTDWGSYDTADTVRMLQAGISWITPGSSDGKFTAPLEAAVKEGRLSIGQVRENAFYLLRSVRDLCRRKG